MGREIRKVPPNWKHPQRFCPHKPMCKGPHTDCYYCFQPQLDRSYKEACLEWYKEALEFKKTETDEFYHEYSGMPPDKRYYINYDPDKIEKPWYQLYETVSEGTPVSPPFATKEELADYLAENGDYWDQDRRKIAYPFNCQPWGKEQAYKFVFGNGYAPSMVFENGKAISGVEFVTKEKNEVES